MKKGWQIIIRQTHKCGLKRFWVTHRVVYLFGVLVLILGFAGFHAWSTLDSYSDLMDANQKLNRDLKIKNSQLQYLAHRMDQLRDELASVRDVSTEVQKQLGKVESKPEGGLGGPSLVGNTRDVQRAAYLNSESELLNQMWTEIEEIEVETTLEQKHNTSLLRFLRSQSALLQAIPNLRPIKGGFISSPFGRRRDPFNGSVKMHMGIDIAHSNNVPVYATAEGIVVGAAWNSTYGNLVTIYHGFGLSTRYAHLYEMHVSPGDWVDRGQTIGLLGDTGRSTHNHLHYEVRIEGRPVNPYYFLPDVKKG